MLCGLVAMSDVTGLSGRRPVFDPRSCHFLEFQVQTIDFRTLPPDAQNPIHVWWPADAIGFARLEAQYCRTPLQPNNGEWGMQLCKQRIWRCPSFGSSTWLQPLSSVNKNGSYLILPRFNMCPICTSWAWLMTMTIPGNFNNGIRESCQESYPSMWEH